MVPPLHIPYFQQIMGGYIGRWAGGRTYIQTGILMGVEPARNYKYTYSSQLHQMSLSHAFEINQVESIDAPKKYRTKSDMNFK